MVVNKIVKMMKDLGFSGYEAQAYIAFQETNPCTAYEVARASGIPTSKIYQVIEKLIKKGLLQPYEKEGKKMYTPLEPEEFIDSHKSRVEATLNGLKEEFARVKSSTDISIIWNIKDYNTLLEKGERLIQEAGETLLVSTWPEELNLLYPFIKQAEKRGVKIAAVHFGTPEKEAGMLFTHPIKETIFSEKGGRGLVLIADSREALAATVHGENKVEGAWSLNQGFVTLAEDYIKHDIYIMKIVKRFNEALIKKFGPTYYRLRDIFSDEEE